MNIAVFGLGYVGSVTAACLAARGHRVLGVDNNLAKVEALKDGRSSIIERGLEDLIREGDQSSGVPVVICDAPDGRGGTWSLGGTIVFGPNLIFEGLAKVSADGGTVEPATLVDFEVRRLPSIRICSVPAPRPRAW